MRFISFVVTLLLIEDNAMVDDDGCASVGCSNENEYDAEPGSPGFLGYLNNDNDEVQQQLEYLTENFQKAQEQHIHEQRLFFKRLEERMEKRMGKFLDKMDDLDTDMTVHRYNKTYTYDC